MNTFLSYFQLSLKEMAEHVIKFAKVDDITFTKPKDMIPWVIEDKRKSPYIKTRRRFILTNSEPFVHPGLEKLPERRWKQKVHREPHKK